MGLLEPRLSPGRAGTCARLSSPAPISAREVLTFYSWSAKREQIWVIRVIRVIRVISDTKIAKETSGYDAAMHGESKTLGKIDEN